MQDDFQNYISFKKQQEDQKSTPPAVKNKTQVFKPKHLYDSEYKVPMLNERVLQDHHPKKMAVIQRALERFEQNLEMKNKNEENHVENHFKKIQ